MPEGVSESEGPRGGTAVRQGKADKVDCREAAHELYHYLDGELTEESRRRIAEHLDRCGHCAGAAEFERELRQVIADRCRDHVPDALRERIATAIEEERRHCAHGGASAGTGASTGTDAGGEASEPASGDGVSGPASAGA